MIYSRTMALPGLAACALPLSKKVAIVGCGGVGTPAALYLASLVKELDLYDCDVVEEHNLNRQLAYRHADIGAEKVSTLAKRVKDLNPECDVHAHVLRISEATAGCLHADLVIDATDNADTRFVVGQHCFAQKIPQIYASASLFQYNVVIFNTGLQRSCFRCLLGEQVPSQALQVKSANNGIFGPAAGICGALAATQCFLYFTDPGRCCAGLLLGDVRFGWQRTVNIARKCAHCQQCTADI